ncbi:MAG: peptide chain release factor N(5)-glutamine methyltransferase [Deltaproteobacteria bacterium]|nr:peptide chain release factor N(5)-glutamine methyltransferase [Deltaproteobacteria bacterium]
MSTTDAPWTILSVLDWTRGWFAKKGLESPRLDAELLVAHVLHLERVMLYARFDQPLLPAELSAIKGLVLRRGRGEPVAYILGHKEFFSLELEVGPDVLIPRPDTEVLVEVALARLADREAPVMVDVGTGSGNIAISIASQRPNVRVFALDVSAAALALAAKNAKRNGVDDRVTFLESNLLRSLPSDVAPDLVVANLPYIRSDELARLMPDVRDFEPRLALDGGPDGLVLIRRLIAEAPKSASLALEAADDQIDTICAELARAGFSEPTIRKDYAGKRRVAYAGPNR